MGGIRNLCKLHGHITIQGRLWVWDYVANQPVPKQKMRRGSERWKASEKARAEWLAKRSSQPQPALTWTCPDCGNRGRPPEAETCAVCGARRPKHPNGN